MNSPAGPLKPWPPRLSRQAELDRAEAQIVAGPPSLELLFSRAVLWQSLGRLEDAKSAYVEILRSDARHRPALVQLGALLSETDFRRAAITVYRRILALWPDDTAARVSLGNVLWEHNDHAGARACWEAALALDQACAAAHQGMAAALGEAREDLAALEHARRGFQGHACVSFPYRGDAAPLEVLVLASAVGGNIPLRKAINDRIFRVTRLIVEFHDPTVDLPDHHLVWNSIGEADRCADALRLASALLKKTRAPVLNRPETVALSGRADNSRRLAGLPGLVVPLVAALSRADLEDQAAPRTLERLGLHFPLLLRAQGFHAGKHFVKLENAAALPSALASMPGESFAVLQFLDARSRDGAIRKYRVLMLDGRLYPLHAAVSDLWKIHYFSADMAGSAAHRAEDEAFLLDMPGVLGPQALAVLQRIQAVLGLDYAGIDFSLTAGGEVLFFEANATMVIAPPDADERWNYRRAPVQKALDAITNMLRSRIPKEKP